MLTKLLKRTMDLQRLEDRHRFDLKWQQQRKEEELRGAVNVQAFVEEPAKKPIRHTVAHRLEEKRAALQARDLLVAEKPTKRSPQVQQDS